MGTRSRSDVNSRCTVRGPVSLPTLADACDVLTDPALYTRKMIREADKVLKRHAKWLRRIHPTQRTKEQVQFLEAETRRPNV